MNLTWRLSAVYIALAAGLIAGTEAAALPGVNSFSSTAAKVSLVEKAVDVCMRGNRVVPCFGSARRERWSLKNSVFRGLDPRGVPTRTSTRIIRESTVGPRPPNYGRPAWTQNRCPRGRLC